MERIVEVENLMKALPPGVRAVDGIPFRVERGRVFGLLGSDGAGLDLRGSHQGTDEVHPAFHGIGQVEVLCHRGEAVHLLGP